jgi:hypothetical protein
MKEKKKLKIKVTTINSEGTVLPSQAKKDKEQREQQEFGCLRKMRGQCRSGSRRVPLLAMGCCRCSVRRIYIRKKLE